jgi:hypothetical protein
MIKNTVFALAMLATLNVPLDTHAQASWDKVAAAPGKSGTEMAGGVCWVGLPRSDLHVVLDGVAIKPALALGSWLATGAMTMVMGDLVLTKSEIRPMMQRLSASSIEIEG